MKLTGSVGRMGRNDKGDVALVQQALATVKVKGLRPTGKLDPIGPGITRLRQTLPSWFRATQAIRGTTASVSGQPDPRRAARKAADKIKAVAPFPVKGRNALADAIQAVAKELDIALASTELWITRAGQFAAGLEIDGDLAGTHLGPSSWGAS